MKKWILNLGLTTLTVLPIVTIASCSLMPEESEPKTTIEQEAARFQIYLPAKTPGTLTADIISVINAIDINQADKLIALQGYVDDFPTVEKTYTLTIGLIKDSPKTSTFVDIPITVSLKNPNLAGVDEVKSVTVLFRITGLIVGAPSQQLDAISKLLKNRIVLPSQMDETASQAKANLQTDIKFNEYYQYTPLPVGFSYSYVGKSAVNKIDTTTLDVTLKIANSSLGAYNLTIYKVIQISGFKTATPAEIDAQKFAFSGPLYIPHTSTAQLIWMINGYEKQEDKLKVLKLFSKGFPPTEGYTIVIGTLVVDPSEETSIMAPMMVTKNVEGETAMESVLVTWIVTGLRVEI